MVYYIDSQNYYRRGPLFAIPQILGLVELALIVMLIIENRKNLSRPLFVTSLSFFVLPIVTTIVQILHYGLALQAIAITISIQFTFVVDTIEMNKKIRSQDDAYQKASYEAQHDGLTDLWSKSAGREQIENYFAHMQEGDQAVLIFVDIDDFKQINDTCGHLTGDHALIETARRLGSMLNEGDIAGRIGGDEFAVIMVDVNQELSYTISEKITVINKQLYCPTDGLPAVSLSVGVAFTDRANPSESIFKDADKALYRVKQSGKHGCGFY